jgi:hypothetical protein
MIFFDNMVNAQNYRTLDTLEKVLNKFKKEISTDNYSSSMYTIANKLICCVLHIKLSRSTLTIFILDNPILVRNKIAEFKGVYLI